MTRYLNLWTVLGVIAGAFVLPRVIKGGLGNLGWNPNWGTWRPLGQYRIGAVPELTPLLHYSGTDEVHQLAGIPELTPLKHYSGSSRQLGQAYFTGESPFWAGMEGEYEPTWKNAPLRRDIM